MKIVKASNGKTRVTLSKKEWKEIGRTAGWMKQSNDENGKMPLEDTKQILWYYFNFHSTNGNCSKWYVQVYDRTNPKRMSHGKLIGGCKIKTCENPLSIDIVRKDGDIDDSMIGEIENKFYKDKGFQDANSNFYSTRE